MTGEKRGIEKSKVEFLKKLLNTDVTIEDISGLLDLTEEEIKSLMSKYNLTKDI